MTWSIGTVAKNVNNTNPCTTVAVTVTLTAGRSYLVFASGFQTGGGTRTLTCASDLDGALTADLSSGAVVSPAYLFRKDAAVGGSTVITVTASGNMLNLMALVTEVQVSAMVFKGAGIHIAKTATTDWDSGAFDTTAATEMLYTGLYITNRSDGVISACDDNNGNNYTVGQKQATSSGESSNDAYFFGTLAQENAEAEATVSVAGTGRMLVAAYAGGGATPIVDTETGTLTDTGAQQRTGPWYQNTSLTISPYVG